MATRYIITFGGSSLLDVSSPSSEYNSGALDTSLDKSDVYVEFFD